MAVIIFLLILLATCLGAAALMLAMWLGGEAEKQVHKYLSDKAHAEWSGLWWRAAVFTSILALGGLACAVMAGSLM